MLGLQWRLGVWVAQAPHRRSSGGGNAWMSHRLAACHLSPAVPSDPAGLCRAPQIWSFEPSIFRIFYCTGWETTVIHYRRLRDGKLLTQARPIGAVGSGRGTVEASGGRWRVGR